MKLLRWMVELGCVAWLIVTTPPDHPEQPEPNMNRWLHTFLERAWLKWLWSMKMELFWFLASVAAFIYVLPVLRALDSTAAGLDAGTLSFVLVGVVAVIVGIIMAFLIIRAVVPLVDQWFDGELEKDPMLPAHQRVSFKSDWLNASPAVRLILFTGIVSVIVLGVVIGTVAAF